MATIDVFNPARDVLNQAPSLHPINLFDTDVALGEALEREGGGWGVDRVREAGAVAGSVETLEHGRRAERNLPILRTHDRYGNRIDEVELDPSWHLLLRGAVERSIHSLPWREPQPGAHVVRAALFGVWGNANDGVMCPVSMTYAAIPALRDGAPELAAEWEPRLTTPDYEHGALAGMAMTERQGGSDVRANVTRAEPVGDGVYEIHGHKWFCSYPPCDVFLVLAQAPAGLSCLLVERGPGMEFQRLKDKLGTRSLPSSEVEFHGIHGRLIGEEGRGVPAIIRMVNHTRLDCLLGATTGLRRGTLEAIHHARHRSAFGALLVDQPAMQNVLADLAIESEAATASAMRVARSYDEDDAAFRRFATAVMKYWVSKRAAAHAAEALECLGGNGFIEDSGNAGALPRRTAELDLGGIGQRRGARRAAGDGQGARGPAGVPGRVRACGRRRSAPGRPPRARARGDGGGVLERRSPVPRAPRGREPRGGPAGVAARALLARGGGRRLLRGAARRRGRPRVRDASRRGRRQGDHRSRLPRMSAVEFEVDGRVARITLNRPERGNGITRGLLTELEALVERADLDPEVHVILLAGAGKGFCGGYDLVESAEGASGPTESGALPGSPLHPLVIKENHSPGRAWDPMVDHAMMSRNVRAFMSLYHCSKPVVCKVHGFCVAGGTDMALCSDLLVIAADAKIGYPPARVWGSPTTAMWAYRVGPQRAKRLLFTGDSLSGRRRWSGGWRSRRRLRRIWMRGRKRWSGGSR